jgi:hypothetical protein
MKTPANKRFLKFSLRSIFPEIGLGKSLGRWRGPEPVPWAAARFANRLTSAEPPLSCAALKDSHQPAELILRSFLFFLAFAAALTLAGCFEGPKGDPGPQGAQGEKGEKGDKGDKGDPGKDAVSVPAAKKK